jgi:hypothetical protein
VNENVGYRNEGLLAIWRDLTAEPVWKYEELPPLLLPDVADLDLFEVGDTELARAHWFWSCLPKLRGFPTSSRMNGGTKHSHRDHLGGHDLEVEKIVYVTRCECCEPRYEPGHAATHALVHLLAEDASS